MSLAISLSAPAAHGSVVEYNTEDRDQWFTDVGGPDNVSTVDFTGFDDFTPVTDQWAHLGVHFSGFVVTSGFDDFGYPNDGWGIEGYPDINVTFDEPINWIAADFPGQTRIELYDNGDLIHTTGILGSPGTGHFGGVISDQAFDAARFYQSDTPTEFLDDLHFGPVIAVPAPGGFMVLCSAALMRRRRRRAR